MIYFIRTVEEDNSRREKCAYLNEKEKGSITRNETKGVHETCH